MQTDRTRSGRKNSQTNKNDVWLTDNQFTKFARNRNLLQNKDATSDYFLGNKDYKFCIM